jgi:hypothetical protein
VRVKKPILPLFLLVGLLVCFAIAEEPKKPAFKETSSHKAPGPLGYFGGSPFPPGEEPRHTSTISAFWTTEGAIDRTEITIAHGDGRPSISAIGQWKGGKLDLIENGPYGGPDPDCLCHLVFVASRSSFKVDKSAGHVRVDGCGQVKFRVYANKGTNPATEPTLEIKYYSGKELVATTSHPLVEGTRKAGVKKAGKDAHP